MNEEALLDFIGPIWTTIDCTCCTGPRGGGELEVHGTCSDYSHYTRPACTRYLAGPSVPSSFPRIPSYVKPHRRDTRVLAAPANNGAFVKYHRVPSSIKDGCIDMELMDGHESVELLIEPMKPFRYTETS